VSGRMVGDPQDDRGALIPESLRVRGLEAVTSTLPPRQSAGATAQEGGPGVAEGVTRVDRVAPPATGFDGERRQLLRVTSCPGRSGARYSCRKGALLRSTLSNPGLSAIGRSQSSVLCQRGEVSIIRMENTHSQARRSPTSIFASQPAPRPPTGTDTGPKLAPARRRRVHPIAA